MGQTHSPLRKASFMQIMHPSGDPEPDMGQVPVPETKRRLQPLCRHEVICAALYGGYQNDPLFEFLCECREVRQ
ncbi:hypothetical protein SAMN05216227_105120 [Pseudorhodobacter antarcticus]|uniref:Uncharacterized protein n=3 Tax=Pseudorhodobacter antarcticus TaxID=1077947 RepID=A0A1H8M8U2_9RHOB|nr:hypothetical protein SAMN05216227_105120 [Pseudorhodobacter antarcticus]